MKNPLVILNMAKVWLLNRYAALAAFLMVQSQAVLAELPTAYEPSSGADDGDFLGLIKGFFKDTTDLVVLVLGVVLTIGPVVVVLQKYMAVRREKGEISEVFAPMFVGVLVMIFGIFLLTQAGGIIE